MAVWRASVELRIEARDRHRWLAVAAFGGLVVGALMAVFGLPPVDVHGLLHYAGIMDPACGGTRSVWAAMQGDWALSWRYNPVGIPLVVGAAATLVRFAVGLATGRWLNARVRSWPAVAVTGGVLFVLLGVNQQFHADLLRTPAQEFSPIGPILNAAPALALGAWIAIRRRRTANRIDRPREAGS
ncbi:hypothetical protein HDA32_004620 [Spinactinospora alkalitolerans]|uniref:DUF2752 domain-containing protein n=1 Tax=Spinactinospora alkalitolerans TaxID=687207 RepID=A0A852U6G0_9ACTN|nr:DUF2752 domain-containing protein [Spinactinospora alkalitolerans]NYE49500.1 hypothetical protein [Spinactinospora alkalitolerans]